jgi:hypothetical protein
MLKLKQEKTKSRLKRRKVDTPSDTICDVCEEEATTRHCNNCKKASFYCDECFAFTHRAAGKQAHAWVAIAEFVSVDAPRIPTCAEHGEPIKLHCSDCDMIICMECGMFEHGTHTKVKIADMSATARDGIVAAVGTALVANEELSATKTELDELEKAVEASADAAFAEIDGHERALRQAVTTLSADAKAMVRASATRKLKVVAEQLVRVKGAAEHTAAGVDLVTRTLAVANLTELVAFRPVAVAGLAAICNHGVPLVPPCAPGIAVVATPKLAKAVEFISGALAIFDTDTNPSACTAAGAGLTSATVGAVAKFVVTTVDFEGKQRAEGGDMVTLVLLRAFPGIGAPVVGSAEDRNDGTYNCSYIATAENDAGWELEVKVNGIHVVGSPFSPAVKLVKEHLTVVGASSNRHTADNVLAPGSALYWTSGGSKPHWLRLKMPADVGTVSVQVHAFRGAFEPHKVQARVCSSSSDDSGRASARIILPMCNMPTTGSELFRLFGREDLQPGDDTFYFEVHGCGEVDSGYDCKVACFVVT